MRFSRRTVLAIGAVVAVSLVGAAFALHYTLTSTPLASVNVSGGTVHLEEGQDAGRWWFGSPWQNLSSATGGFPLVLSASGTFTVYVPLVNSDNVSHTVNSVSVAAPFGVEGTGAPLPVSVAAHEDESLTIELFAPPSTGSYTFNLTVTCFG